MEIRMNFTDFIKIKSIFKLVDLSGEVLEHKIEGKEITGILGVSGKYMKDDLTTSYVFNEEIPFSFVFTSLVDTINDIDCINLEYEVIDSRGIEISFEIKLDYELKESLESDLPEDDERQLGIINENSSLNEDTTDSMQVVSKDDDSVDSIPTKVVEEVKEENNVNLIIDDNTSIEELKDEITSTVNKLLTASLSVKDDNLPTNESVFGGITERKSTLRVCYFNDDLDLERVCKNNNVSLNQVFNENKNLDISSTRRVIINE